MSGTADSNGGLPRASDRRAPSLPERLRSQEVELHEAIFAQVCTVEPDAVTDGDPQLEGGLRETIAACIACGLASIERGASWWGPLPSAVADHACHTAASGMSLTTALSRCLVGFRVAWRFVLSEVTRRDLLDEQKLGMLLQASVAMESVHARLQAEIVEAHSCEIERKARSQEQRRTEIVHKLLAGGSPDASELAEIGYELDAWHLGVIATGMAAGKAVRCLQVGLGCELLAVAGGVRVVFAWLGTQYRLTFADIERVFSAHEDIEASLAVGEPARGLEGWRVTHHEAAGAALVAREWPARLTQYAAVAPDATAVQDEALGDSLVESYLSPLDDTRIGGEKARKTLRALFAAEHNVSSAAHALGVHRSSVHRWLKEIEDERLGFRLYEHQAEIERALRIEELRKRRTAKTLTRRSRTT